MVSCRHHSLRLSRHSHRKYSKAFLWFVLSPQLKKYNWESHLEHISRKNLEAHSIVVSRGKLVLLAESTLATTIQ